MEKQCRDCRFWDGMPDYAVGACHYNAPTAKSPDPWPQTQFKDWCREWTAKESEHDGV